MEAKSEQFKEATHKRVGTHKSSDGNDHATAESPAKGPLHEQQEPQNKEENEETRPTTLSQPAALIPRRSPTTTVSEKSGTAAAAATVKSEKSHAKQPSRERRMRHLIAHRTLLLERLHQGRVAANQRLEQWKKEHPTRATETGEEERVRWMALGREISSLARKNSRVAEDEPFQHSRTQLSLRRGSSVGKRMNAALSSLAPRNSSTQPVTDGGATTTTPLEPTAPLPFPPAEATPVLSSGAAPVVTTTASLPTPVSSTAMVPSIAPAPVPSGASKKLSATVPIPVVPPQGGRGSGQKALHHHRQPMAQPPHPSSATQQPPSSQGLLTSSLARASAKPAPPPPRGIPPHNILGLAMRRPTPPVVVLPEAVALREQRQRVETQLVQLAHQRQTPSEAPHSSSGTTTTTRNRPDWVRDFCTHGVSPPPRLPQRRRTQWDVVLEEMRWLATDFIEERKWKLCTARAVAQSVVHSTVVSTTTTTASVEPVSQPPPHKEEEETTTTKEPAIPTAVVESIPDRTTATTTSPMPVESPALPSTTNTTNTEEPEDGKRKFAALEEEEEDRSKNEDTLRDIAKTCTSIVSQFWSLHQDPETGDNPDDDVLVGDSTRDAASHQEETKEGNRPVELTTKATTTTTTTPTKETHTADDTNTTETSAPVVSTSSSPEKRHVDLDEISDTLDHLIPLLLAVKQAEPKPSKSYGVDFFAHEATGVGFMEELWKMNSVGCLLSGPVSSGKTFSTCAILWKYKSLGPQLVVCSADSLVKWLDELHYFEGVSPVPMSTKLSSSLAAAARTTTSSLVVICSFSDLKTMTEDVLSQFQTIVVDSRYPVGFRGSRPPTCLDTHENSSHSLLSMSAPKELASTDWWERIVSLVFKSNARRIVVDHFSSMDLLGLLDGFSDRMVLEHLSLRAAFLYGSALFSTEWKFSKKNLLGWARRHIKRSADTTSGADGTSSKFLRVRGLFCKMLDMTTYTLVSESKVTPQVEIVLCEMTPTQRTSYEYCCNSVKTALSRRLEVDTVQFAFRGIAEALMRLRRICTHADAHSVLDSSPVRQQLLDYSFSTLEKSTNSQPDAELASFILKGSGKFRELSRILVQDGGVTLEPEIHESAEIPQRTASEKESQSDGPIKVAILAVLPEVQLLVSLLLGALGVCHEVLLSYHGAIYRNGSTAAWLATQRVLSRFNDRISESSRMVNVVVASPIAVAGNHGGLGVESANLVVVVDEDWSGRGDLLMRSLFSRVSFANEQQQGECRVLRLISQNSCEENFCVTNSDNGTNASMKDFKLPWPVNAFGLLEPPHNLRSSEESVVYNNWISSGSSEGLHLFPGRGLFAWSNENLEKVLCNELSCRPLFGRSSGPLFLPSSSGSLTVESQVSIMKNLSKSEGESSAFSFHLVDSCIKCTSSVPPFPNDFDVQFSVGWNVSPVAQFARRLDTHVEGDEGQPSEKLVVPLSHQPVGWQEMSGSETVSFAEKEEKEPTVEALAGGLLEYDDSAFPALSDISHNVYASSFLLSNKLLSSEGSQGMELLVYFPPIFPRLLESAIVAPESVPSPISRESRNKRVRPLIDGLPVKKLKLAGGEFMDTSVTAHDPPLVTEENSLKNDAAAVLLDLTDDYGLTGIGAIPLPRDSALFSNQILADSRPNSSAVLDDFEAGAHPIDHSESEESRHLDSHARGTSNSLVLFIARRRQRGQMGMPVYQPGRSHPNLNNVVVPWAHPVAGSATNHYHPASNGLYGSNGVESGDRQKKNAFQDPSRETSIVARPLSGVDQNPARPAAMAVFGNSGNASKTKDMHRSRLIAASRQYGHGATLFDAAPFRAAAVRLRNKLSHRLSRLCWQAGGAYESGPGLPLAVSKPLGRSQIFRNDFQGDPALWTSVVKRLKSRDSKTGDEAIEVSHAQSSDLRRSLSSPCRVDFGPFKSGFLYLPSGMTATAPPRPSVGVTLPMGVKLPPTSKDQIIPWTPREEVLLKKTVLRFGTNWALASRALSGLQDLVTVTRQPQGSQCFPRASKSCKEHWQILTRNDSSLGTEAKKVERRQRETFTVTFPESYALDVRHEIIGGDAKDKTEKTGTESKKPSVLVTIVPSDNIDVTTSTADVDNLGLLHGSSSMSAEPTVGKRRTFSAISSARKKLQSGPSVIPGITDGASPNIAHSHPSHMQSVQSSVASSWTGGRTEMWPLQFLDASDRFRANQAQQQAAAAAAAASSTGPSRSPPPSAMAPVARQHSAPVTSTRPTPTAMSVGQIPTPQTNPAQRSTSNPYPPSAVRADGRAQSAMHVFVPPQNQSSRTPSAARQSTVPGGSPARK